MPRSEAEVLTRSLRDPRLAVHAVSALPVWLWATDGTRVLWTNAAGAAVFGRHSAADLVARAFGPADQHRRQVARLARLLPSGQLRLERLQGFGALLGRLRTCACSHFAMADGTNGLLVAAVEPTGRALAYSERVQRLVDGFEGPAIAFDVMGQLIDANATTKRLIASERQGEIGFSVFGLDLISAAALNNGHAMIAAAVGDIDLCRVGQGGETTLLALITPSRAVDASAPSDDTAPPIAGHPAVPAATQLAPEAPSPLPPTSAPVPAAPHFCPETQGHSETAPPAAAQRASGIAMTAPQIETLADKETPTDRATADDPQPAPDAEPSLITEREEIPCEQGAAAGATPPRDTSTPPPASQHEVSTPASLREPFLSGSLPAPRRHPLRFVWQMDAEGHLALGSDEFLRLIGPRTATAFGRPWSEVAARFALDPEGRVAAAIATRDTWSGITVNWPVDESGASLPVEISGLPIYDRARQFAGYRGFGICRDLDALDRLATQRHSDALLPAPVDDAETRLSRSENADAPDLPVVAGRPSIPSPQPTDAPVETPPNVVPFRPANDSKAEPRALSLTPVENNAFNELARQLASRLEAERIEFDKRDTQRPAPVEQDAAAPAVALDESSAAKADAPLARDEQAAWAAHTLAAPRADSRRDALLYDRIPVGILIYQLDRLIYANRAFLDQVGYADLQALASAGGLDALFVEPGVAGGGSASEEGTPVRIASTGDDHAPAEARLHSISWDGDAAHALIFSAPRGLAAADATPVALVPLAPAAGAEPAPSELHAILDASDDGIFIIDRDGGIVSCNDGARRLFGASDHDTLSRHFADLFTPESCDVLDTLIDSVRQEPTAAQLVCELTGLSLDGRALALQLTIGGAPGARLFAICRELPADRADHDAAQRKQAKRTASARADILARISQDLRTPLNAIIGFADVMIEERFGALGNDRYAAYLRDIRASGERVLAIINDMVDLSRAETGQLQLRMARQDLNEIVEQCVTVLQPQANRERIIIRTALAQALPPVTADAAALRQIVLNLVGNSIHVARAGGQIIVSTAVTDLGDIVLRVRDTGRGLNHAEMEAALEQFRAPASEQVAQDNAGINMSLTRALVEANRAQFHIKSAPHSGTLIEVAFPPLAARAG